MKKNAALDILDNPSRILNVDETSLSRCLKTGKVIASKGYKNGYDMKKGNENQIITLLFIISSNRRNMPPMVAFLFLQPNKTLLDGIPKV